MLKISLFVEKSLRFVTVVKPQLANWVIKAMPKLKDRAILPFLFHNPLHFYNIVVILQ